MAKAGSPTRKECSKCREIKPLSEFHRDRKRKDGYSYICRDCTRERDMTRRQKLRDRTPEEIPNVESKTCSKCLEAKSTIEFYRELHSPDGFSGKCKQCICEQKRSHYRKLAERSPGKIPSKENKRCPLCGGVKSVSQFYKGKGKPDGYRTLCKECDAHLSAKYVKKIANRDFASIQRAGVKTCSFCHQELPAEDFNYDRGSLDGLASHCRKCGIEYKQKHYAHNEGEYYARNVEQRSIHPERIRAYRIVEAALRNGEITRPESCSKCGKTGTIVAHHNDYDRPLHIAWLCLSCDRQLHADLRRSKKI